MLEVLAHSNIGKLPKSHAWIEILIGKGIRTEELRPADRPGWDSHSGFRHIRATAPKPVIWDTRFFGARTTRPTD